MNIAGDLVRAFNDGYEKGKADAEFYLLHCGDTDDPTTNADRIRAMADEELAEWIDKVSSGCHACPVEKKCLYEICNCKETILWWLKQEATDETVQIDRQ